MQGDWSRPAASEGAGLMTSYPKLFCHSTIQILYSLHCHSFVFTVSFLLLVLYMCILRPCRNSWSCLKGVTCLGFKDPKDLLKADKGLRHIDWINYF